MYFHFFFAQPVRLEYHLRSSPKLVQTERLPTPKACSAKGRVLSAEDGILVPTDFQCTAKGHSMSLGWRKFTGNHMDWAEFQNFQDFPNDFPLKFPTGMSTFSRTGTSGEGGSVMNFV